MLKKRSIIADSVAYLQRRRARNTSSISIFELAGRNPGHVRLLAGKLRRLARVKAFLKTASDDDKQAFLASFIDMIDPLFLYSMVSQSIIIVLDNSILEDVLKHEHQEQRKTRFMAFLAFLSFAEDYCLVRFYFGVTPVILFEAHDRRRGSRHRAIAEAAQKITQAMQEVGVDVAYLGPNNVAQVGRLFRGIEKDENVICKAMVRLKTVNFKIDVSHFPPGYNPISTGIAEGFLPNINLRYLSAWYVKYVLINDIERRMFEANKKTEAAKRIVWVKPALDFPRILKVEGGKLKGMGDVELFSLGELNSQTARRQFSIIMPVTADKALRDALKSRSQVRSTTVVFEGGKDNRDDIDAGTYQFSMLPRREAREKRRSEEYNQAFEQFIDEIFGKVPPKKDPQNL